MASLESCFVRVMSHLHFTFDKKCRRQKWYLAISRDFVRIHDDVIKWKHFPRNWPCVRGIHRSPVNSPHKGQWRGALMFSLNCIWISDLVNNHQAGDLRRYRGHYDVIVMILKQAQTCIGKPTKHPHVFLGLYHFALFEFINAFANDYPSHYIIHTQHDCPSLFNLLLLIIKFSFICKEQPCRVRITHSISDIIIYTNTVHLSKHFGKW